MDAERIERLTEAQKACLRLVLRHYEMKEIARQLSISPTAVVERLRAARHVLGVSRSVDAARVLAVHEGLDNTRYVDTMPVVEESVLAAPSTLPTETGNGERTGRHSSVQEVQASYVADFSQRQPDDRDLSIRIPFIGSKRDDLKPWQIICCFIAAGALAIVAFGLFLKINLEIDTARQVQLLQQQHPP